MSRAGGSPLKYRGRFQHVRRLPRAKRRLKTVLLSGLLFVVGFGATGAVLTYRDLSSQIKEVQGLNKLIGRETNHNPWQGRALNVLVIGSDSRQGEENAQLDGLNSRQAAAADRTQRSDTTMLMHINADHTRAYVVSIPRDTLVDIPSCELANGKKLSPRSQAMFNSAFMYGGGPEGDLAGAVACTWKTVESMSGLKIDESVVVDFSGFAKMIDALGGISIYVDQPIRDREYSGLELPRGCHKLNGADALDYARVRHGVVGGDGSDLQRIKRQQRVMSIMMHEAIGKNFFTSPGALYGFARGALGALSVSDGLNSLPSLTSLALSMQTLTPAETVFFSLPVKPAKEDPNRVVPQEPLARQMWRALREGTALPQGIDARTGDGLEFVTGEDQAPPPEAQPAKKEIMVQYPGFELPLEVEETDPPASSRSSAPRANGGASAPAGQTGPSASANPQTSGAHSSAPPGNDRARSNQRPAPLTDEELAELQAQCEEAMR